MFERAKNMPTRPSEEELSSQLGIEMELIQENLDNAQPLSTACLPPVSQKDLRFLLLLFLTVDKPLRAILFDERGYGLKKENSRKFLWCMTCRVDE